MTDNAIGPCAKCQSYTAFSPDGAVPTRCAACGEPYPQSPSAGPRLLPAIPAKQWRKFRKHGFESPWVTFVLKGQLDFELGAIEWKQLDAEASDDQIAAAVANDEVKRIAAAISMLNDLLPDSDPRKITSLKIAAMLQACDQAEYESHDVDDARAFANALQSYLPPTDG